MNSRNYDRQKTTPQLRVTVCHKDGTPIKKGEKIDLPELKEFLSRLLQERNAKYKDA